jgi:hypothetical protein
MALIAVQNIGVSNGIAPTYQDATASDTVAGGQGVFIHVKNAHTVSTTVTIVTPESVDGDLAVADRANAVANATERMIPVPARYNDPTTGLATVTFSVTNAAIDVAALRGPLS